MKLCLTRLFMPFKVIIMPKQTIKCKGPIVFVWLTCGGNSIRQFQTDKYGLPNGEACLRELRVSRPIAEEPYGDDG